MYLKFTITKFLIIISSVLSLYSVRSLSVLQRWSVSPYNKFHLSEFYKLFTAPLVHSDTMHWILSMISLYMVGEFVEGIYTYHFQDLGKWIFLSLYIGAGIFAQLPILYYHRRNPYYLVMGSGGGISAVIATAILLAPNALICSFSIVCLPSYMIGVIYLSFLCYLSLRPRVLFNYFLHLSGALFSFFFNLFFIPELSDRLYHMVKYWFSSFLGV